MVVFIDSTWFQVHKISSDPRLSGKQIPHAFLTHLGPMGILPPSWTHGDPTPILDPWGPYPHLGPMETLPHLGPMGTLPHLGPMGTLPPS